MNLEQIKQAVLSGKKVFWKNENYEIIKDSLNQWFIKCHSNGSCIGLFHTDGKTLNGDEKDFFVL